MDAPAARLMPQPLVVESPTLVRHIDLGYARFDVPLQINGEVVQHGNTQFFTIADSTASEHNLTVCPLATDSRPELQSLFDQYERVAGRRPKSYWEVEKAILFANPFSVWTIPFRGRKRAVLDMQLVTIKGLTLNRADTVLLYETENIGAIVTVRPDMSCITIADKRHGTEQRFLVRPADAQAVASALIQSYHLETMDFSEPQLLKLAAQAGIRRREMPADSTDASVASESARLQAVVDEVRKRRAAAGH